METENRQPFWSVAQIAVATYVAGLLGGCYCLGRNYQILGQPSHAKWSYAAGAIGSLFFFALFVLMPAQIAEKIPNAMIPLSYLLLVMPFLYGKQRVLIEEQLAEGWKENSLSWAFLVILSLLVLHTVLLLVATFLIAVW